MGQFRQLGTRICADQWVMKILFFFSLKRRRFKEKKNRIFIAIIYFMIRFNLGRFSERGPQRTLYLPRWLLQTGMNEILVFESDAPVASVATKGLRTMSLIGEQMWWT